MGKWKKYLSCATAVLLAASNLTSSAPAFAQATSSSSSSGGSYTDNDETEIIESSETSSDDEDDVEIIESSEEEETTSSGTKSEESSSSGSSAKQESGKTDSNKKNESSKTESSSTSSSKSKKDSGKTTNSSAASSKKSTKSAEEETEVITESETTSSSKKKTSSVKEVVSEGENGFAVYSAVDAADMAAAVSALEDDSSKRLTVSSDTDLSDVLDKGTAVYYDGTYIISFDSTSDRKAAYKAIADEVGDDAVTNDTILSVCGNVSSTNEEKITENISDSVKNDAEAGLKAQDEIANGDLLVALIDTGCDTSTVASVNLTSDGDTDVNGHGTRMAEYMQEAAGDSVVQLLSIKAFNDDGTASLSNVAAAVKYATEAGASIINISASVKDSDNAAFLKTEIENAVAQGVTVIASAGNNGKDASDYVPANVTGVTTIGAATDEGKVLETSNTGDCVNYYVIADSTSEAAAKFTGYTVAQSLKADAIYTAKEIKEGKKKVSTSSESTEKAEVNGSNEAMLQDGATVNSMMVSLAGGAGNIQHIVVTNNISDTSNKISIPETVTSTVTETYSGQYGQDCWGESDNGGSYTKCQHYSWTCPVCGKKYGSDNVTWHTVGTTMTQYSQTTCGPHTVTKTVTNYIHDSVTSDPIYMWYDSGSHTIYIGVAQGTQLYFPKNADGIFANLPNLKEVNLTPFNFSYMESSVNCFANDTSVTNIHFPSSWKFTDVSQSGLASINSNWYREYDKTATCNTDFETKFNAAPGEYAGLWKAGTVTYYVTYANSQDTSASGAQIYSQSYTCGDTITLKGNEFGNTGHTFTGWSTTFGGSVKYTAGQQVSATELKGNVKLYPVWGTNSYTVNFNANGGSGDMPSQARAYGDGKKLSKCTFTKGSESFAGWSTSPNGTANYTDETTLDISTTDGASVTLYAIWGTRNIIEKGQYFQNDIKDLMAENGTDVSAIQSVVWITDLNSVDGLSSMPRRNISDWHQHSDADGCYRYETETYHICTDACGPGAGNPTQVTDPNTSIGAYHHGTGAENGGKRTITILQCSIPNGTHLYELYAYYKDGTLYLYNAEANTQKMRLNADASNMFSNWSNLKSMDFSIFDLSLMKNNENIVQNDKNIKAITFPSTWKFSNTKASGLPSIDEHWHKEDDDTQDTKIWHIGANGSGNFEGTNGHKAGDGCQTVDLGEAGDGAGENFTCDTDSTTGFETMFNSSPAQYAGTWLPGLATSHRYWKTEGVANLNNMIEVHHPEAPFTTYCWAQHRGPNAGYYDRIEIKSEAQMIANLQVYNQAYRALPTSQLLLSGESSVSNPMTRSFITIMYYGDVETDPLGLRKKYGLSEQELAYVTMGCVQWCSDSAETYAWTDAMAKAKKEILSQSYKNIPNVQDIKFYIYLSAHEGGGQQQMGIESLQTKYYGGVLIRKINSIGEAMSGCEFTVYSDEACTQAVRTYTSNADGEAGTCRMDSQYGLAVGTYYIKETSQPKGYEPNNDVFKVIVKKDRVTETGYRNGGDTKEALQYINKANIVLKTGTLTLRKVSTEKTDKGLVGAIYGVYAASDITATRLTGDTTTLYKKDEKVTTITTGATGYGSVILQQGNYYVKEEAAPGGYEVDVNASGAISVAKGATATPVVADNPKKGTFTITAQKIIPKGYKIKAGMFTFELYKQEAYLGADGKPALTKVDTATNDANGKVTFKELTYSADEDTNYHGEVQYAIKEVAPTSNDYPRYLYDDHIEYVAGAVIDDGSDTLKIKLTYTSENSDADATFRTTGQFTNSYIKAPEIPNPTKTVSKGRIILKEGLHNVIDYEDSYQYDVYQQIPKETKVDYFKNFSFYDVFPAGVKVDSWNVYADGKDVTSKWKFTKTTANEKDDDKRQDTVTAVYIGDYNDASMYGVTYDFRFQVTETKEVAKKESFYNYAAVSITYQDVENHYILDADGNVTKDASGNPVYETTNPYTKNGNTVADPNFKTATTTDETKAVHYRTTNDVQTDVYPRFTTKSWDINKHVYNDEGEEINTWAVHNGDIVTYKITANNKSQRMDGKITITDPLPSNVTFVDADNGGTYDEKTGIITWTDLAFKAGKSYTVTFRVKVNDSGAFTFDNRATVVATCDNARSVSTTNPDAATPNTTDRISDTKQTLNMHNYVPEMKKIVTDADGYNINEVLVSENSELTYHLYVYNSDNSGSDPNRTGKHTFTITDKIPANTELVSASEGGQTVSAMPGVGDLKVSDNQSLVSGKSDAKYVSWTEEFTPGEMKVYTFKVRVIGKGVSVVNQAAFATHNTPYDDPASDKESNTTYPLTPGNTGDTDDPEYPSNVVVNGVPSDPLKEVKTLGGNDINKQLLQVGDTYQYVITLDNPTACYKTYTLTDTVPDHVELVNAYESVVTKTDDSVKDVANIKENPTNTVAVDGRKITWVADIQAGETREFVFTFKTLDKDSHWKNMGHVVISHNVPINPLTETPIQGGKDYPIERDTNEVENWTPADPVKSVSATPNEADAAMDMHEMLVFGENADTLTYKISFRNNTTEKKLYTLEDKLDSDLDFVSATDKGTYDSKTRVITWRLTLSPGESKYVTFDARVNVGNRVASANNQVQMLVDQAYPESNITDTDIDSTPTKTVTDKDGNNIDDFLVNKGDTLTYTIRVHNPDELTKHFTVYDEVPENSELIEALPGAKTSTDRFGEEVISSAVSDTSTVEIAQSRTKIAWEADIPSGETWAFIFTVKTTKKDSYVPNEATVTVDRSSIKTNLVENWVPGDPMKVVTEDGTDVNKKTFFKEDRSKITYEISAKNPSTLEKTFTITDVLDEDLDFLSADNNGTYDKSTRKVTWTMKIAPGETVTVKVNVQFVEEPTKDKIVNTADVTSDNWHNVTNTVENYITYSPVKKVVTKSDVDLNGKLIFANNEYKYTITWKNPTDEAHTYTITDKLQDNVIFVSADSNGTANGQTITWKNIAVGAGEETTVSMIVKADYPLENKQVDNKAKVVDSKESEKYSHETNTVTVYISQIQKTVTDETDYGIYGYLVSPGDTLKYHIRVENPSKVQQTVTITDTLPKGLQYVSSEGTESNGTVTFASASVPAGGKDFTITTKVTEDAKSVTSITNKASASANNTNTSLESNKVVNYVLQAPVKTVATTADKKDADGATVKPETSLTYSITFKNTSEKPQDFTVTDKVDKRLAIQKINDGGKLGSNNTITWVTTLQAGETKTVTFEANAPKCEVQTAIENEASIGVNRTSQTSNKKVTVKVTPTADTSNGDGSGKNSGNGSSAIDKIKRGIGDVNVRATGDASNMIVWIVLGCAAMAACVIFFVVKKKRK